jgi:hypothetical protein
MLRHARMTAMTGRAAAFGMVAGRRLWAGNDRLGKFDTRGGERTRGGAAQPPQQPSRSYDVLRLIAAASEAILGMSELWIPISARSRPDIAESSRHVLS